MIRKNFNNGLLAIAALVTLGASVSPSLFEYGMGTATLGFEPKAIIASLLLWPFVHYGFLHLFSNAILLTYFGSPLEGEMGMKRYAGFFAYAVIIGAAALVAFQPGFTSVGLDVFAFAVCSYTAVRMRENRHPEMGGALVFLVLFAGVDFLNGFGYVASLSGAASGVVFRLLERFLTKKKA